MFILKFLLKFILFVICLVLVIKIYSCVNTERIKIDGVKGEVLGIFLPTDTKYSENYSHKAFNQVRIGMSEKDVIKLLGEPLYIWHPYKVTSIAEKKHFVAFQYSKSPSDTHYRYRQIQFDKGIVAEKNGYFYID